jgi:hypothetical protein
MTKFLLAAILLFSTLSATEVTAAEADTSTTLKRQVTTMLAGKPQFDELEAPLAGRVRDQWPNVRPAMQQFGALKSIVFQSSNNDGDLYLVTYQNAVTNWLIKLSSNGKVETLRFWPASTNNQY